MPRAGNRPNALLLQYWRFNKTAFGLSLRTIHSIPSTSGERLAFP